jgi:hypothetical protein
MPSVHQFLDTHGNQPYAVFVLLDLSWNAYDHICLSCRPFRHPRRSEKKAMLIQQPPGKKMRLPMLIRVTIAVLSIPHNVRCRQPLAAPTARFIWSSALLALLIVCGPTGCAAPPQARSTPIPTWELAEAQPTPMITLARLRVPLEHQIPKSFIQPLCPEYALVIIESDAEWKRLRERIDLIDAMPEVDLRRGMIVGLMADVGEASEPVWPISFEEARVQDGLGWLTALFHRGIYYPVKTAPYLEIAYVPRMRRVRRVDINNRSFALYLPDEVP